MALAKIEPLAFLESLRWETQALRDSCVERLSGAAVSQIPAWPIDRLARSSEDLRASVVRYSRWMVMATGAPVRSANDALAIDALRSVVRYCGFHLSAKSHGESVLALMLAVEFLRIDLLDNRKAADRAWHDLAIVVDRSAQRPLDLGFVETFAQMFLRIIEIAITSSPRPIRW